MFQPDAFQGDAFQVEIAEYALAFQPGVFQLDAFQTAGDELVVAGGYPAFMPGLFQLDAFQTIGDELPVVPSSSGGGFMRYVPRARRIVPIEYEPIEEDEALLLAVL